MATITVVCNLHNNYTNSTSISLLPDDIVSKILCCLNLRNRAIASQVCKTWHNIISLCSINENVINDHVSKSQVSTRTFCAYCCSRIFHRVCYHTFYPIVVKFASDNVNLMELYLTATVTTLTLSPAIFQSRVFLTVLSLKNCKFDDDAFDDIQVMNLLKEVCFVSVQISPIKFVKLMKNCPSIVDLTLINCFNEFGVFPISLPDLNQLKKVHLSGIRIGQIEIKARNLLEFNLLGSYVVKLDLSACTKLRVLNIDCEYIPIGFPVDISSAFPCLKSLFLHSCRGLQIFKISSSELESLTLSNMVDLNDAVIVTPNLRSLKIVDMTNVPNSCPIVGSSLVEVEIGFKYVSSICRLVRYLRALGENLSFSLTTDAETESKLMQQLNEMYVHQIDTTY